MAARPSFDLELEQLNIELIKMGALIEKAIENCVTAFKTQDYALAKEIIKNDRVIDDIEKVIESKCLSLILRQQPVARDLRSVSTALKMVTDMERIGDQAADIADLVMRIDGTHIFNMVKHIPDMAMVSKQMVHDAIDSFVNGDVAKAEEVMKVDDQVDDLFNLVKEEVVSILKSSSENSDRCVDFLMIAKYFERIGDHAVNICEWVEFNETGDYKNYKMI